MPSSVGEKDKLLTSKSLSVAAIPRHQRAQKPQIGLAEKLMSGCLGEAPPEESYERESGSDVIYADESPYDCVETTGAVESPIPEATGG